MPRISILLYLLLLFILGCRDTSYLFLLYPYHACSSSLIHEEEREARYLLIEERDREWTLSYRKIPTREISSLPSSSNTLLTALSVQENTVVFHGQKTINSMEEPLVNLSLSILNNTLVPLEAKTGWDPIQYLLHLYLSQVRPQTSPYLYWFFRGSIYQGDLPEKWMTIRDLEKEEFGRVLMAYPFAMDLGGGLLDFSPKEEDFFFLERGANRDCDNWARMWFFWAKYRGYPVWEIAIIDGWNVSSAHMFTIFRDEDGYNLCNYFIFDTYPSLEEAIFAFQRERLTARGPYQDLRYVIYQESIP